MGNIVSGIDLIRKTNEEVFGITTPLITTSSEKMAKPKMEQYGYQKIN